MIGPEKEPEASIVPDDGETVNTNYETEITEAKETMANISNSFQTGGISGSAFNITISKVAVSLLKHYDANTITTYFQHKTGGKFW